MIQSFDSVFWSTESFDSDPVFWPILLILIQFYVPFFWFWSSFLIFSSDSVFLFSFLIQSPELVLWFSLLKQNCHPVISDSLLIFSAEPTFWRRVLNQSHFYLIVAWTLWKDDSLPWISQSQVDISQLTNHKWTISQSTNQRWTISQPCYSLVRWSEENQSFFLETSQTPIGSTAEQYAAIHAVHRFFNGGLQKCKMISLSIFYA